MKLLIVLVMALVLANTAPAVVARGRIFNSIDVQPQQLPSLVRLKMQYRKGEGFGTCSGTLISVEWVLSAAHCMAYNGNNVILINVFMGSNQENVKESNVTVSIDANNLKIHENYNRTGNVENDIAVLKTPKVRISVNVNYAELPLLSTSKNLTYFACLGTMAGWGVIDKKGSSSSFAQWNYCNVINKVYCQSYFSSKFYDSQLCVYKKNVGACSGDSGGPLYVGKQVVGIASYISSAGCESNNPMVYTNVNFFVDWIKVKTNIFY